MTIEKLTAYGADVSEGLQRCMNNEDFYLKMVTIFLEDPNFPRLSEALDAGKLDAAFEAAHALKGTAGNLSLTPLFRALSEITELLRKRTQTDYSALIGVIRENRELLQDA